MLVVVADLPIVINQLVAPVEMVAAVLVVKIVQQLVQQILVVVVAL